MVVGSTWKVVGGEGTGGIIVRKGKELSSEQATSRLAVGSLVREEALVGLRLLYVKMTGSGPEKGWVSLSIKDKSLLVPHQLSDVQCPPKTEANHEKSSEWKGPFSEEEWASKLSPPEYQILRCGGTDPFGVHPYVHMFPPNGHFVCAGCGLALYSATAKFRDCGWPAWDKCFHSKKFGCHVGVTSVGGAVFEIHCARCDGHLGHVFFGEGHTEANERH